MSKHNQEKELRRNQPIQTQPTPEPPKELEKSEKIEKENQAPPPTHNHPNVPRLTPEEALALDEPTESLELRTARSKMGFKLTVDGPHTVLLLLTEYDLSKGTYWGITIRSHGDVGEKLPVIQAVSGYKHFDADPRTDMVFVELEEDTAKIRNRLRHLAAREPENQGEEVDERL